MNNRAVDRAIIYIYGFGWLIGGIVYFIAGILDPALSSSTTNYTSNLAAGEIAVFGKYWYLYVT